MSSDGPKVFLAQRPSPSRAFIWAAVLLSFALLLAGGCFVLYEIWDHRSQILQHAALPPPVVDPPAPIIAAPLAPLAPIVPLPIPAPTLPVQDTVLGQIDSHRVLHLPLSNSFDDSSPNKHPISVTGGVTITSQGARFAGSGWLEAPHISLDNHPFAIALWILPQGKVMNMGLLEQLDVAENSHYLHLMLRNPDCPRLGFYIEDLQTDKAVTMELGWTHLVFQYTGWKQEVWMNGQLAGSRQCAAYKGESGPTLIGKVPNWDNNPPTQNFRGMMRDLRIYDLALTPAQIKALSQLTIQAGTPAAPIRQEKNTPHDDAF